MTLRIVLAEDNILLREGVRALLDAQADFEVVGVAGDAAELVAVATSVRPDVVVTDIKMPPHFQLEGIEAAQEIRERFRTTGVVVVSSHDDEEYAIALLGKGHRGLAYLLKDRITEGDDLFRAIREVARGGSMVDPIIADRLQGHNESSGEAREILRLMAAGCGYAEIADQLGTTSEAVDHRMTDFFGRLAGDPATAANHLADEFRRLHAAVVARESSTQALRSYVPAQIAERLTHTPDVAMVPEELEVTVLFSDLRGFTSLAEKLDPRQVAEILTKHLAAMAEVVVAHDGTLDKFAGDAVMAVFGAPEPSTTHAADALRCAIAMQQRQRRLNEEGFAGDGYPVEMGIGVNTGAVIAGTVGGAGRLEYTVVGDAVNVAARLQSAAGGGEIVAAAVTIGLAPDIAARDAGLIAVKGRKEPVEVFRVIW